MLTIASFHLLFVVAVLLFINMLTLTIFSIEKASSDTNEVFGKFCFDCMSRNISIIYIYMWNMLILYSDGAAWLASNRIL